MRTTARFLDADLVNDKVYLMVGIKQVTIVGSEYIELNKYANDYRSGLEKKGLVFKFNEKHSFRTEGVSMASRIREILSK